MTKFNYDDVVCLQAKLPVSGSKAWIVGVTEESKRVGSYYEKFPPGTIYTIEFEDGTSTDVHESEIEKYDAL